MNTFHLCQSFVDIALRVERGQVTGDPVARHLSIFLFRRIICWNVDVARGAAPTVAETCCTHWVGFVTKLQVNYC